jgi:hypothetical protein
MDCDEFKRRLLTDPMDADPAFRGHARRCAPCAAEAERALAFEAALRRALAAESGAQPPVRGSSVRRWLLPGLLPLLAGLAWWGLHLAPNPLGATAGQALGRMAIEHVQAESALLDTAGRAPVPARQVRLLLHNLGVEDPPRMDAGIRMRHAGRCRVGARDGVHLVMDGKRGPVTALLMPQAPSSEPATLHWHGLDALLLPLGHGAVALVGEPDEPLRALAERLGLVPRARRAPLRP